MEARSEHQLSLLTISESRGLSVKMIKICKLQLQGKEPGRVLLYTPDCSVPAASEIAGDDRGSQGFGEVELCTVCRAAASQQQTGPWRGLGAECSLACALSCCLEVVVLLHSIILTGQSRKQRTCLLCCIWGDPACMIISEGKICCLVTPVWQRLSPLGRFPSGYKRKAVVQVTNYSLENA